MGGASKVEEVSALGVVELERSGQRLQHAFGDAAQVSAFQTRVVRNADAGQDSDLFTTQAWDAPRAVGRQASLLRRYRGAAGGEELLDLLPRIHETSLDLDTGGWETLPVALSTGTPTFTRSALC